MDKSKLTEEIVQSLKPFIKKTLNQTSADNREDLEQELYLKIIQKIHEDKVDELPGFFEMLKKQYQNNEE